MVTVFTPTYNRAYIIENLYKSLLQQINQNFEWLIVDDGSTDNTQSLIQTWINENKIPIRYFKQTNGGKHRAINKGVQEAQGELFFIVDSDDQLLKTAIELVSYSHEKIKNKESVGGVCGQRAFFDGTIVSNCAFDTILSDSLSIRYREKITGDLAEVFKISVLRKFPFPEYKNEKFCPEALIWNRIAQKYQLLFFNKPIYMCEYLKDGLTAKIVKIRMQSPLASMDTYAELFTYNIPLIQKIKAAINFWRFSFNAELSFFTKVKRISILKTLIFFPMGWLLYLNDKRKL